MGTPTRDWPWLYEGYRSVRLSLGDGILPPTSDQLVSHVAAVVKAADSVKALEEGVREFRTRTFRLSSSRLWPTGIAPSPIESVSTLPSAPGADSRCRAGTRDGAAGNPKAI